MRIINDHTSSLCDICCEEVPAKTFKNKGEVYLIKTCKKHGEFTHLIEKDLDYYTRFAHVGSRAPAFYNTLVIPVTYRCNLNCKYCYAPHTNRADMTLDEIKKTIIAHNGKAIAISGGEPTLRDDLLEIIAIAKGAGKKTVLLTNGLKLADLEYVKSLKASGIDQIFFSFDSFSEDFYDKFKGSKSESIDLLNLKKMALSNIEKESMSIV
ncbi:MAG: radical SAM protein, partial [Candidatus Saganbacteria bacterium]|nr:radical SAM protein [Candidatus Saganbacteria bacterium]